MFEGLQKDAVAKSLDVTIVYLRVVHLYDYYSGHYGVELPQFMRTEPTKLSGGFEDMTRSLDNKHKALLDMQVAIKKEEESKYRCAECLKLFKGADYVKRHLSLKHGDLRAVYKIYWEGLESVKKLVWDAKERK